MRYDITSENNYQAAKTVREAEQKFKKKRDELFLKQEALNDKVYNLSILKQQIWDDDLPRYVENRKKIKNTIKLKGEAKFDNFELPEKEMLDLKKLSNSLKNCTGADLAISIVLGFSIFGAFRDISKSCDKVNKANEIKKQVDENVKSFDEAIDFISQIQMCVDKLSLNTAKIRQFYDYKMNQLEDIIKVKTDYLLYTYEEKLMLQNCYLLATLLKDFTLIDLVKVENDETIINKEGLTKQFRKAQETLAEVS
jgi:hypothetical protein